MLAAPVPRHPIYRKMTSWWRSLRRFGRTKAKGLLPVRRTYGPMQSDARRFNSSSAVLATGSLLADRYLIEFILGQGGQGAVYFALDLDRNGEPVALKEMLVPRVDPRIQLQAIEQFRQEAMFLHRLDHPNLAKVYDFFEEKERYYLVMDYIKGKSLGELLKTQNQPFQVIRVLQWAIQLAGVLAYLHSQDPHPI